MSVNQSKGNTNDSQQYRRSGRSGNPASQRNFSGGGGGGKGGGGSTTAPPSSSFNSGKSFKKVGSNAQGAQNRVTGQNGAHVHPPLSGTPDVSVSTGPTVNPSDASVQKSTPGLPKSPQSNAVPSGSTSTVATGPATPVKGSADASKAFCLQFGSISPGVMNGMQVPARTNSAPPNLDEQKRVQARLDSLKAASFQNPPVPKPRKDADQSNVSETHPIPISKEKRDDVIPSTTPIKPSGPPMPSIPMQIPFHQSQNYLQFGGPNPALQSQATSMPMPVPLPMHLPVGNPPFVPGIQHHPMSSQGIIHQNQGLNFTSQMGHQIGNIGMGLGPQYQQQQQMGNSGGNRRTVKITHPETHEELRLDKYPNGAPSGPRPQHPPSFPTPHPINYYSNSYNAPPLFYPPPGSNNPLTSGAQITPGSQPPRFYNHQASKQVTVKPAVPAHQEKAADSDKGEIPKIQKPAPPPHKDSEVVAGVSLLEPAATSVATSSKPPASSVAIEEPKHPDKKGPSVLSSSVGHEGDGSVQETPKDSTSSLETNKDVVEVSKVDSDEKGCISAEVIGSGTDSDKSLKAEGPVVEERKECADESQHSTVETVSKAIPKEQQKEPVDVKNVKSSSISTSDINAITTGTSLLNLDSSHTGKNQNLDAAERVVSVSVPETSPLTLEVESKGKSNNNNNTAKGKKKIKEILKNADARGSTSDLYNAYKRPEEKKETSVSDIVESSLDIITNQDSVELSKKDVKFEPDDWEDAADISAPKLETSNLKHNSEVDNEGMTKKYSRDFLLKFSEQCADLPEGFQVTADIVEALMGSSAGLGPHPSPGRGGGGPRLDRRLSNVSGEDDKWNKGSGQMGQGRDMRIEPGYNAANFRGNHGGVLRTPRPQPPGQYNTGGILSGPIQSPGPMHRSDSDRWQRATGYQKGLIPSPTPMPVMHKAEKKYEVGKITDEEQAKQRQLKGILNKLTPQNFEKLFEQVKQVNIDNAGTLSGVIDQIFDKALMEPTFVEMYANFCSRLAVELPDFSEDNEKITFKRLLLNKCQVEFERGDMEQAEANRTDEEGEVKQTEEQREEKRIQARRRMLGNIRLIGELYKKKMLTERIMHECIKKLFGEDYNNPDEENIESLCKLLSTIGGMIDHAKAKEHMDVYFDMMSKLSDNMKLSSRVRFMLKDVIDLRKNRWQQRRKVEGPKKIEEVHRDAANERQAQSNRLARGPNPNPSMRRGQGQPMDFGSKGSNILPNPQMGYRGLPQQQQPRGYGNQDSRFEERHSFENRTLSVPLRPVGDDNITLGPQGGLARGMSLRGQPSMRGVGGPNGYGSVPERPVYAPRDDSGPRYSPRPAYEPEHRVQPSSPPPRGRVPTPPQSGPSLSEDRLHDMSMQAIKEFYSARDEKEVALCVKDLNAPGFYPSMVSLWVTDSFERKDMDRESLAKLLINLTKSQEILSQDSLVRGFESVLLTLEDAVNDAPRAAEFLGRMFARVILENVIPYKQVSRLVFEGGEEQGRLVEIGLAGEVIGVILEIVKAEKGDPFLNDLRAASDPRLDKFKSSNMKKASRLDKFIC